MFNKQGRHVSESMRFNSFKKFLASQKNEIDNQRIEYKGFYVSHLKTGGHWFIDGWKGNAMHSTLDNAKRTIDRCLEIRAEVAQECLGSAV